MSLSVWQCFCSQSPTTLDPTPRSQLKTRRKKDQWLDNIFQWNHKNAPKGFSTERRTKRRRLRRALDLFSWSWGAINFLLICAHASESSPDKKYYFCETRVRVMAAPGVPDVTNSMRRTFFSNHALYLFKQQQKTILNFKNKVTGPINPFNRKRIQIQFELVVI